MEARLKNLTRSKWVSTVASIWIQCTSGTLYTFSVYSQTLKTTQGYDQSTLDTVSVFKDFGANCGILSGVLYSYSVSWAGPWVVLLAGAVQCFLGYFLMWAAVVGLIPRPPVVVMCLFMLLAAHAQSFFNTSNAVTGVRNFPYYKGTIVGIMKGFLGLSGAIIVQIYQIFMYEKTTSYLLMLALLPPINTLLLMWFVRIHNTKEGNEKQHLDGLSIIALVVAAYLMCIILLENFITLPLAIRVVGFVVLVLLLASPLCVVIRAHQGELDSVSEPFLTEGDRLEDGNDKRSLRSDIHLNLLQAMCTIDFWMLFIAMVCGMGSGLAVVNNLSQIGQSLGYRNFEISTLVSLLSIWNFFGRLGAGYISDCFLHRKGWARPLFMVITLASMSIGHLVIASGMPGALYTGSVLVGVCYGSQWSLMPTITSEIFGVLHMGTIFNAITIASPVGSYIFSVRVIGYIYDKEASEPENTCFGTQCFMLSFLIMAAATLFGALAALALFFQTRSFYSQDIDGNRNREQNDNGNVVYACCLDSEFKSLDIVTFPSIAEQRSECLVHLGNLEFCLVQSGFYYRCYDYQSVIKVTGLELVGDNKIEIRHSTVIGVPVDDFEAFHVQLCFSPDCEDFVSESEDEQSDNVDFTFKPD